MGAGSEARSGAYRRSAVVLIERRETVVSVRRESMVVWVVVRAGERDGQFGSAERESSEVD